MTGGARAWGEGSLRRENERSGFRTFPFIISTLIELEPKLEKPVHFLAFLNQALAMKLFI